MSGTIWFLLHGSQLAATQGMDGRERGQTWVTCWCIVAVQARDNVDLAQVFSALTSWTFWARKFFVIGAVLCIAECLAVSPAH